MIVVCGATGQVGSAVVTELLGAAHEVRALVQPGIAIPWPDRAGLDVTVADFDDAAAMQTAIGGAEALFMMSPPHERQVEWQQIQVDAAQAAGVTRVVKLSAFDTGPDTRLTMGRWHWAGEQALRASGLPHAILRPQYFMENLLHDEMPVARRRPSDLHRGRPTGGHGRCRRRGVWLPPPFSSAVSSTGRSSYRPDRRRSRPPMSRPPSPGFWRSRWNLASSRATPHSPPCWPVAVRTGTPVMS